MAKEKPKKSTKSVVKGADTPLATEKKKKPVRLPVLLLFFVAVLLWSAWYYGCVFHLSREYSFWVADTRQLDFILSCSFGSMRYIGRALLMTFKYPWLGGILVAFLLTVGTWLVGYCWRLKARWRFIQYLPALVYMGTVTYLGLDSFFETETGYILGIPFLTVLVLAICGIMIRSFSRKKVHALFAVPADETQRDSLLQLAVCIIGFVAIIGYNEWKRPYVRVISQLAAMEQEQDWEGIQKLARAHSYQSNRPMACMYAIALVHTDQRLQNGQAADRLSGGHGFHCLARHLAEVLTGDNGTGAGGTGNFGGNAHHEAAHDQGKVLLGAFIADFLLNMGEGDNLKGHAAAPAGQNFSQFNNLFLGLLGSIGEREKVHRDLTDAPPGNHPGRDRAVDASGEQRYRDAVGPDRQSACAVYRAEMHVGGKIPYLDVDGQFGIVNVHRAVRICLGQFPSHVLAELDTGHGEALVAAL